MRRSLSRVVRPAQQASAPGPGRAAAVENRCPPVHQATQLLAAVLQASDEDERLEVLDLGPALPETVAFFSGTASRLYIADLFADLPIRVEEEAPDYRQPLRELLPSLRGARLDVILFWDLFNYLPAEAIIALQEVLQPHLHPGTRAHAFGVHKRSAPENTCSYAILGSDTFTLRSRRSPVPNYTPLSQARLQAVLTEFRFERSVLLGDGRLELLLSNVAGRRSSAPS